MILRFVARGADRLDHRREEAAKIHEDADARPETRASAFARLITYGFPFTDRATGKIGLHLLGDANEAALLARLSSREDALQLLGGRFIPVESVFVNGRKSAVVAHRLRELLTR